MECKPLRIYMKDRGLEDDLFLRRALEHTEAHPLFDHRFFKAFIARKLSLDQVKVWAKQRLFSSRRFPCFLGAFISRIKDAETRHPYIKQIYEEHGNLDPKKIHSRQLECLVFALGVSRKELDAEPMLPETRAFIKAYMSTSRKGTLRECMGMYALGEPVIAMEMVLLLKGLATIPWLKQKAKIYVLGHAHHDYRHTVELGDALRPHLKNPSDEEQAWRGFVRIIKARERFYDGIAEAIGL